MSFYTYLYLREDGTPYYVGKGCRRRAYEGGGRNNARRLPPAHERIIIQEYLSEEEAFEAEKFLIAFFGRKDLNTGILRNLTDGGEGVSGIDGKRISDAKRGQRYHMSPQGSRAIAQARFGNKSHTGRDFSLAHRKALRDAATGRKMSSDAIARAWQTRRLNKEMSICPPQNI